MAKKVVGQPISVQEHKETLSATVDVESGMTDFIIKRTLVDADNGEVIVVQKIRETAPTGEVESNHRGSSKESREHTGTRTSTSRVNHVYSI